MIRVRNKRMIRNLAVKSFQAARRRNIVAVIAIAMTTLLFTSLFTLGFGMAKSMERGDMILSGGDGHGSVNHITEAEYQTIKKHALIKEIAYSRKLSDHVNNEQLKKRPTEFWYYDDLRLHDAFDEPTTGQKPQAENEIITDTTTLELLGIPQKIGAHIKLELTIHNKKVSREFVLSGWWKSYPGVQTGLLLTSKAYVTAHVTELDNTYRKDQSETGTITAIIKFASTKNLKKDMETLVVESGFSMDSKASNYINTGINPRYLSKQTTLGMGTAVGLCCALFLFIVTGYLIIYNIFQISVLRDLQFYGLLKTIGTTGRQLSAIIRRQAWMLSLLGIPWGLLDGYLVGKALLPTLLAQSSFEGNAVVVSPSPLIFVAAALFALVTVEISVRKPAKMAAKVSPIEAVHYTEASRHGRKRKERRERKTPQRRMAWENFIRNKKRTILVVLGLSLSIVLANTVFIFSESVDPEHALKNASDSDFRICHADLFFQYKVDKESALSESFVSAVKKQEGFKNGGYQYGCKATYTSKTTKQTYNEEQDGSFSTHLYGLDQFPFSRLQLVDGTLDEKKLASGDYILEGIWVNSRGVMDAESRNHELGDKVRLQYNGKSKEVTVIGHVIANEANTYDWVGSCFFLTGDAYKKITGISYAMSYIFDTTKEKEASMEQFLKQYTNQVEPTMSYKSKFTILAGVANIRDTMVSIGGTIACIIGIIGILNFINTMLTSIFTRQREFAILQSIGMTGRQLLKMLCLEGGYYVACTAVCALLLSILTALVIVRPICKKIWFLQFHFNVWLLGIIFVVLLVIGVLIPYIAYRILERQSVVERLKMELH